jgi:acetyltransferase-like isoleucine patch superfamily enzyme
MTITDERRIVGDWYDGTVPHNVRLHPQAYVETTESFQLFRSRAEVGLEVDLGAGVYTGSMFDVGPRGRVRLGRYSMVNCARLICDDSIEIGDHVLVSWNAVIMDSYRRPDSVDGRRAEMARMCVEVLPPGEVFDARPIVLRDNVWIGFDAIILPGVTIGEGSIVGARSVVTEDVPPYTIAAGNPARIIRAISPDEVRNA